MLHSEFSLSELRWDFSKIRFDGLIRIDWDYEYIQKVIGSRTMQLKKRVINVLFQQVFEHIQAFQENKIKTAIVSIFYVYPLLLIILAMYFSIAFLPDIILFGIRLLVVVRIMPLFEYQNNY